MKKFRVLINYIFESQGDMFHSLMLLRKHHWTHTWMVATSGEGEGHWGVSRMALHSFEWFSCVARNKDKKKNPEKKKLMRSLGRKTLRAAG